MRKRTVLTLICCFAAVLIIVPVSLLCLGIIRPGYRRISTPEELMSVADDPDGKYMLDADIDMSGYEWDPIVFGGILDGRGHAVTNLTVSRTGSSLRETVDGNRKVYDTQFAGVFDVLTGEVVNVEFRDLKVEVDSDMPCFAGGVAGFMEGGRISDCKIDALVCLKAHDRMFGVGGVAGAGYGTIESSDITVTLICIDTDAENKDEQFMGGAAAVGYPDIIDCNINIDGYASEHGYAHNGGIMGMYIYEKDTVLDGRITGNRITGQITFFEDNEDRRAYCDWYIGEVMSVILGKSTNEEDFVSNEVFDYDHILLPSDSGITV